MLIKIFFILNSNVGSRYSTIEFNNIFSHVNKDFFILNSNVGSRYSTFEFNNINVIIGYLISDFIISLVWGQLFRV